MVQRPPFNELPVVYKSRLKSLEEEFTLRNKSSEFMGVQCLVTGLVPLCSLICRFLFVPSVRFISAALTANNYNIIGMTDTSSEHNVANSRPFVYLFDKTEM